MQHYNEQMVVTQVFQDDEFAEMFDFEETKVMALVHEETIEPTTHIATIEDRPLILTLDIDAKDLKTVRKFEEKKKLHANHPRNLFKVYEDEWKRLEHLTSRRRQQHGNNQSHEGDQSRDNKKPRENDQLRDSNQSLDSNQQLNNKKPRMSDQSRDNKKPRESDQPRDNKKPRESDQSRDKNSTTQMSSKQLNPRKAVSSIQKSSSKKKDSENTLS
uniref:Uncharacterized protein n=2 Tax=Onchocerca TaxID=6281 RepID=A0A8R1TRC1_ONCVO